MVVVVHDRIVQFHFAGTRGKTAVKHAHVVRTDIRAEQFDSATETVGIAVGPVEVEEHLVVLLCGVAHTGAGHLRVDVVDRTHGTAMVGGVQALHQAARRSIEVTCRKSLRTVLREDFGFLEDFHLRGEDGERGVRNTHVAQVEIHVVVQDIAIVAEPVANRGVVVFVNAALPILVQAELHVEAGLGRRLGEEPEVHVGIALVFLSRGLVEELVRRSHGSESPRLGGSAQAESENGLVQRIQLLQEGRLLFGNRGSAFSECGDRREHQGRCKNDRGLFSIHHFSFLPLKFHVNGGFNNSL